MDLKKFATETRNPNSENLDIMSALEIVTLMNQEGRWKWKTCHYQNFNRYGYGNCKTIIGRSERSRARGYSAGTK